MADKKLSDLPGIQLLKAGDTLYVVRGGKDYRLNAPSSLAGWGIVDITANGFLYTYEGATAQSGIGTSFVKFVGFASEGESDGVTISASNDRVTVEEAGTYEIDFFCAFSGTANTIFTFSIHKGGADLGKIATQRTIGTGGDVGSCSCGGQIALAADDYLEVFVKANGAAKEITPVYAQFKIHRVA